MAGRERKGAKPSNAKRGAAASKRTSGKSRKTRLRPALRVDTPRTGGLYPVENYEQALAFLDDRTNIEKIRPRELKAGTFKLDRMHALMQALGDPHRDVKCIHVAGTKGKGSTCEMIAAGLEGCGYTTGLYTSPHLVDLRERIRINRRMISEGAFTTSLATVAAALPQVESKLGPATFFEIVTAAAMVHFASEAVDAAVIEVGLGGRLDSTNVISPEVCAVTSIQLEHTQLLGDTLEKIAREKAGIFKPGVSVLTYHQTPEVMAVFRETAQKVGCPLEVLGQEIEYSARFEATPDLGPHYVVSIGTPRASFEHVAVPLKGEHQALNCGLALAVLDKLRDRGFEIKESDAARGMAKTPNLGRTEQVWKSPRIIIDGAHTPESVTALLKSLGQHIKFDNLIVIFGCAADKDIPGMLRRLAAGADKVVFTQAIASPRAADPKDLQRRFSDLSGMMCQSALNVKDAVNLAAKAAGRDDVICITGSFYIAGEAKRLLSEKVKK